MPPQLDPETLATHLDSFSASTREVVVALRDLILDTVPGVEESIKFNSLCYSIPAAPFGTIGGHVCSVGVRDGAVSLGFIHGAPLPDPTGRLLTGSAKAKRGVSIASRSTLRDPALRDLIRASHAAGLTRLSSAGPDRPSGQTPDPRASPAP